MKLAKRCMAVLLALILLVSTIPGAAMTGMAAYDNGTGGYAEYKNFLKTHEPSEMSPAQIASMIMDFFELVLADMGEVNLGGRDEDAVWLQSDSIDHFLEEFVHAIETNAYDGDWDKIDVSALKGKTRAGGDLELFYAVTQFLSDNGPQLVDIFDDTFEMGTFLGTEVDAAPFAEFSIYNMIQEIMLNFFGKRSDSEETSIDNQINTIINNDLFDSMFGEGHEFMPDVDVTKDTLNDILHNLLKATLDYENADEILRDVSYEVRSIVWAYLYRDKLDFYNSNEADDIFLLDGAEKDRVLSALESGDVSIIDGGHNGKWYKDSFYYDGSVYCQKTSDILYKVDQGA